MRLRYQIAASVVGLLAAAPIGASAQAQRPVAVPIVGSPAAGQPAPPAQVPAQAPFVVPGATSQPPTSSPASSPAATPVSRGQRKLDLSFKDGTLALDAQNVTVRDIFTEWQRRNGCQFVNAEKLPPSPVTIQFPAGTPELDVIDSLLRGLATPTSGYGYIVAPGTGENASLCGAVYIVASSRPTSSSAYMPPVAGPVAAPIVMGSPDSEIPPVVPFMPPGQPQPYPYPGVIPGATPQQPGRGSNTPPASPGFGPIAPTAPGAGRFGAPPPAPAPAPVGNGRGGQ
jgi:hypothetical protein